MSEILGAMSGILPRRRRMRVLMAIGLGLAGSRARSVRSLAGGGSTPARVGPTERQDESGYRHNERYPY